jgi:hypothetical protein
MFTLIKIITIFINYIIYDNFPVNWLFTKKAVKL